MELQKMVITFTVYNTVRHYTGYYKPNSTPLEEVPRKVYWSGILPGLLREESRNSFGLCVSFQPFIAEETSKTVF